MIDVSQKIAENPFIKDADGDYGFRFVIPGTDTKVESGIDVRALIESMLADEYHGEMMVCGCGDAGCAGFRDERCRRTETDVCWSFTYCGRHVELHYERKCYEDNALKMLNEMIVTQKGWNPFEHVTVYESFGEFASAVSELKKALVGHEEKDQREWITVFPDHPCEFAWLRKPCAESELDGYVGGGFGFARFQDARLGGCKIPRELAKRICDWLDVWRALDVAYDESPGSSFQAKKDQVDAEGLMITKELKRLYGERYRFRYSKAWDYEDGSWTVV